MDELIARPEYLQTLDSWYGKPVVKVLVGMRRVGKSTLLVQWSNRVLKKHKIPKKAHLLIERDSLEYAELDTWQKLSALVQSHFRGVKGQKVLLIDEVQLIPGWEVVVNALHKKGDYDIVVTGSNAHMLSSEIATLLSGRYVLVPIFPFSYKETLCIRKAAVHTDFEFERYLRFGGLPALHHMAAEPILLDQMLQSILDTIVLKDVVIRHSVRNVALLERIIHFAFDNLGSLTTAKSIADFCKSERMAVSVDSVQEFIAHLVSVFVLYRVQRYDLRGKRILQIQEKLFANDLGICNAILGRGIQDISGLLENVVYVELLRRGYTVQIGKQGDWEIDFVASRGERREYFQVSYLIADEKTMDREFRPLEVIEDNYPKTVLSMDRMDRSRNGIFHGYLPEWLLGK